MLRRAFLTNTLAASLCACAASETASAPPEAQASPMSSFDVSLYRQLAAGPGNQFVSPFSVKSAFALLYPGARGATASEMAAALGFAADREAAARAIAQQAQALEGGADGPLQIANAAWVQRDFALASDYVRAVRETLGAEIEQITFTPEAAARRRINDWVAEATANRIRDLLPPGFIDASTRLVLTNAVYFKAAWADPFTASGTYEETFHAASGPQTVPMMHQATHARYLETGAFQAASFPYSEGGFALAVFLPRQASSLAAFEAQLTGQSLEASLSDIGQAPAVRLAVALPKVEMESTYDLVPALEAIGVRAAFTSAADFTGISPGGGLLVSGVAHKTFLKIDEAGTEAAAATGIGVALTAALDPEPPPIEFRADRPFFIVLYHVESGTILFLGRVTEV